MREGKSQKRSRTLLAWIKLLTLFALVLSLKSLLHSIKLCQVKQISQPTKPLGVLASSRKRPQAKASPFISEINATDENSAGTIALVLNPYRQLTEWVASNPDTAGARFVAVLRQVLHVTSTSEVERLAACRPREPQSSVPLCMGGHKNYQQALRASAMTPSDSSNRLEREQTLEQTTRLLLGPYNNTRQAPTVFEIQRYGRAHDLLGENAHEENTPIHHQSIPRLGTVPACLPLMLAGYAVATANTRTRHSHGTWNNASVSEEKGGVVVELGPFAGFSSKCIVTGMTQSGLRLPAFFAYDIFQGLDNYQELMRQAPWLREAYPQLNKHITNFLFLWERAIRPVYPSAQAREDWIHELSLHPVALGNQSVALLVVDSAKSVQQLREQLHGLGYLSKGTILFLMDFESAREQVKLVYGCLRQRHLLPVYASFSLEHWAFIVTQVLEVSFLKTCWASLSPEQDSKLAARIEEWRRQARLDVMLLASGLSDPEQGDGTLPDIGQRSLTILLQKLSE